MIFALVKKFFGSHSDSELLRKYQEDNDMQALGVLYKRYMHLIFGLCMNYLKNEAKSEDAVMDIFEKIAKKLKSQEVNNFKSWIYYVSRNHCINQLKPGLEVLIENQHAVAEIMENTPENGLYSKESANLGTALNELKPDQQKCVEMFYLLKLSYEDIQQETGLSYKQVKSHLQNGKRNLKIILTKMQENE